MDVYYLGTRPVDKILVALSGRHTACAITNCAQREWPFGVSKGLL